MHQIRIIVRLGGKVGELGLSKRDLADLCGMQPRLAGEWVNGGIDRVSLVDLATIMQELELRSLDDVLEVEVIGTPPPPEGRKERIEAKLEPLRLKRKKEDRERRKIKAERARQKIAEEIRQENAQRTKRSRR